MAEFYLQMLQVAKKCTSCGLTQNVHGLYYTRMLNNNAVVVTVL